MKTTITIALIFTAAFLHAQTWYTINPTTGLNSLNNISMLNPDHGIAVGQNGVILEYNGTEWLHMGSPVNENLRAVHFLNPNAAWAVGDNGTIIHYNGSQWVQQNSNTTAHLRDVFFLDENTGWAVGNTLLHYNGQVWEVEMNITGLNAIHFYDASEGWIVGTSGRTLKYNGSAWIIVTPAGSGKMLTDVFMTGPASGWLCGFTIGGSSVFQEYDGNNWQDAGAYARPGYGLSFTSHDHGWGLHNETAPIIWFGAIFQINAGAWNQSYTRGESVSWHSRYTGVDAIDMNNAVVSAGSGIVYHYQNGSWDLGNAFADNHLFSIDFSTPTHGHVAAGVRGIQRYENGNWSTQLSAEGFHFNHVTFTGNDNGWAIAHEFETSIISRLYKYTGGEWSVFFEDWLMWYPFGPAYALDADQIWLAVDNNALLFFNELGIAGYHYDLHIDIINSMHFTDAENGWIAGMRLDTGWGGAILRLHNGAWSTAYEKHNREIMDFSFLEDGTAYAVGQQGLLVHYDGNTWSELPSPTTASLHVIHMIDNQQGWAAGENGTVLYYNGSSWNLHPQNLGRDILSICFPEPGFGVMGGTDGAFFATLPQLPVGVETPAFLEYTPAISISPNPSSDRVVFTLKKPEHRRNTELRCYNLLGVQQYQACVADPNGLRNSVVVEANVSAWPPGMYIAVVYSDGRPVGRGKFVVLR